MLLPVYLSTADAVNHISVDRKWWMAFFFQNIFRQANVKTSCNLWFSADNQLIFIRLKNRRHRSTCTHRHQKISIDTHATMPVALMPEPTSRKYTTLHKRLIYIQKKVKNNFINEDKNARGGAICFQNRWIPKWGNWKVRCRIFVSFHLERVMVFVLEMHLTLAIG